MTWLTPPLLLIVLAYGATGAN